MSAWKKLWRNTCVKKIVHAVLGELLDVGAELAQARDLGDLDAADALHDHDVLAAAGPSRPRGTCSSGLPAKLRLSCEALPASRIRSSSFRIVFSYSRTTSIGRKRRDSGQYSSARPARVCSTSRSRSIASRIPGRSTLTTISRPSVSVAACTWAIEAAASGICSKLPNRAATGLPSEASMRRLCELAVERRDAVLELR